MDTRRLTRIVKDRLPGPARRGVRALLLGWGWATADLRPTPRIIVVGAQRAGTTTLFRLLADHPDLVRPTVDKGTSYFDDEYARSLRWYRAHFPLSLPGRRRSTFECSGYYLFHPLAAERIAHDLPDAHVVVLVRDPVERAYSAHRHELARGFEDLPFDLALAVEEARTEGEVARLRTRDGYRSFSHRHHAYLQRSEYASQIRSFLEALGADRVHVVEADVLFADPVREFVDLQRRLGLREWAPASVGRWNARSGSPLAPELRATLLSHFASHDDDLTDLLGHRPAWRNTEVTT